MSDTIKVQNAEVYCSREDCISCQTTTFLSYEFTERSTVRLFDVVKRDLSIRQPDERSH